jgi:hypothetical protein
MNSYETDKECIPCNACGTILQRFFQGTSMVLRPKNILLWHENYKVPFYCSKCGAIQYPWKPIRDVAFVYPIPLPDTYNPQGQVVIPDNYKQFYRKGEGVLLAVGPGFYSSKSFISTSEDLVPGSFIRYNPEVPWKVPVVGTDEKEHLIIICGAQDIWWVE